MTASVAERPAGRGRQASTIEAGRDLRDELHAERAEGLTFALRVLAAVGLLDRAIGLERWDLVDQAKNELGYTASRRQRQLGSVVL